MRAWVRRHPLAAYLVGAYAVSWACWAPLLVTGAVARPGVGWPTHLVGLTGPAVAAFAVTALVDGRAGVADLARRVVRWRVPARWWLLVLATLAATALGVVVPRVLGDEPPAGAAFWQYTGVAAWGPAAVVLVALVVNGLGEETGWRGFAADHLVRRHDLPVTSLLVTAAWAGWHLPLFAVVESFRGFSAALAVGWLLGLAAGSVVLTWVYCGSGRSVLLAASWHTAFNLTSATTATSDVVAPVTSTLVMVGAVLIVVVEVRRGRAGTGAAAAPAAAATPAPRPSEPGAAAPPVP
jgi:membrane protease YdiL (CAAX protease family)